MWLDPKLVTALWAGEAEANLHLSNAGRQAVALALLDEAIELRNSGWTAYEDLNAARIARYVRLVFLRELHLARVHADWAREAELGRRSHLVLSPTECPIDIYEHSAMYTVILVFENRRLRDCFRRKLRIELTQNCGAALWN